MPQLTDDGTRDRRSRQPTKLVGQDADLPSLLRCLAPFRGLKRHCPKLTVFLDSANRSATLGKAFQRLLGASVAGVTSVKD
ncbi:hypothetical protein, partial [Mycobacterium sp.]|uniref:hypothetical protein n=1 Tax=Mycobacterium sp. TaxID=1785 RepID=UPI003CC543A9